MSNIALIFNVDTRIWVANGTELSHAFGDVTIGFRSGTMPIVFRDLSFGLSLENLDENTIVTYSFPHSGVSYVSTDQLYIELVRFEWKPNTKYELNVWCTENNITDRNSWNFTTPDFVLEPYPDYEVE